MTNGSAIHQGLVPCETNPANGELSRTTEIFHGQAVLTVGSRRDSRRHVCADCAKQRHSYLETRPGVLWE